MSYVNKKIVIEDLYCSDFCPETKRYLKNNPDLPVTISFLDKGDYSVSIQGDRIHVVKVDQKLKG